jgi:hypothetical protein
MKDRKISKMDMWICRYENVQRGIKKMNGRRMSKMMDSTV